MKAIMLRGLNAFCVATSLTLAVACGGPESPQSKSEYAALQGAELEGRSSQLSEPVVRNVQRFELLGVRGQNGTNVWVLLRARSEPYYKQVPAGVPYSVPEALVQRLEREKRVSPEVARWLRKGGV
jgi:hypothetical protein